MVGEDGVFVITGNEEGELEGAEDDKVSLGGECRESGVSEIVLGVVVGGLLGGVDRLKGEPKGLESCSLDGDARRCL